MKKLLRFLAYTVVIAIFVSLGGVCVFAGQQEDKLDTVYAYFVQRESFLKSIDETIPTAVIPICNDEHAHRDALAKHGISIIDSSVTVLETAETDQSLIAVVQETLTYRKNDAVFETVIVHELEVMDDPTGFLVVSDAYYDEASQFTSCSYITDPQSPSVYSTSSITARSMCITTIAKGEVGTTETGTNVTKYGSWYGNQDEWCAMFVSWCANQANVSTSIIPKEDYCPYMRDFFENKNRFYASKAYGGSVTPQVGDIYFKGTNADSATHVGIIYKVSGSTIYTIEGNVNNKVVSTSHSLTDSSFVGFGRPAYAREHSCSWTITNTTHSGNCSTCGEHINAYHNYKQSGNQQVCTACGHTIASAKGITPIMSE